MTVIELMGILSELPEEADVLVIDSNLAGYQIANVKYDDFMNHAHICTGA
jgi:hypothetical protein